MQNDAAIQRTQLEVAVAALRRCEGAAKDESARLQAELQAARVEARRAVEQSEGYAEVRQRFNGRKMKSNETPSPMIPNHIMHYHTEPS
jgi:hypothetical protein